MLSVRGLKYHYAPERVILKDVSFDLKQGDILCLLGPNGTGKTTLIRCVLSLNKPKSGNVTIEGRDVSKIPAKTRAAMIAYVPQSTNVAFPYRAEEIVLMGRVAHLSLGARPGKKDRAVTDEAIEMLGISWLRKSPFDELSGGEKQMVLIARALVQQARILVMDEPTANLDYSNQVKMLRVIKELAAENYAILMTSHYPDHAFLACTQALLMRDGVIMAQGAPEDIVNTENLSTLYSTSVIVTQAQMGKEFARVCIPVM